MVNEQDDRLDLVFAALADSTRRDVLAQLALTDADTASVSDLAQAHEMSLPGFMKHLAVLEAAGLIARSKEGRVVRCRLDAAPMQEAAVWIGHYELFWTAQFDALGRYLEQQEEQTPWKSSPRSNLLKSTCGATTPSRPTRSGALGPSRKR
jgi:DNA-binding transcriptional ArsR family regulator